LRLSVSPSDGACLYGIGPAQLITACTNAKDSTDLGKYDAVVIYCERFHVVFGVARLDKF
jgi:hypothetical protein